MQAAGFSVVVCVEEGSMKTICMGLFIGLMVFGAGGLQAANTYVAAGGSDSDPYADWGTAAHSIHDAVAAAGAGDTVFVTNGAYLLTNTVTTGDLTIRSWNNGALDRDGTIIDGNYPTYTNGCFYINNVNALVEGFTITNGFVWDPDTSGNATYAGGGALMTAGTLRNCVIISNQCDLNSAERGGGGVDARGANSVVTNCEFYYNYSDMQGGGLHLNGGAQVWNSTFMYNEGAGGEL